MDRVKIFILGVVLYLSKALFFMLGSRWFDELNDKDGFEERADILRRSFWKSFFLVLFVISGTVFYLVASGRADLDKQLLCRLAAIIIALTASLGRGGWNIQSWKGRTVVERIDRGMFVLSQLGATIILLFALTMK